MRTQNGLKINTGENRGPQCKKAVREQQQHNNNNKKLINVLTTIQIPQPPLM